ncbi:hemagglutinin repeat-containing protein [Gallibacterium anatis]|nr:hemagglutinin repeat-containing protein [Gallibacterium anatis]
MSAISKKYKSTSSSETLQASHQGSTLNAGKVNLTTTESDLTLIGSTITAGNAKLDSAGNLSLLSAQDTMRQRSQNSNSGWSAGVFVGSSGGSYGFGVEGSAQVGKGYENSDSVTHVNSMIQADKVEARSGQDMSLKGGVVTGNKVAVEVGNNFIIESRQDSQQYESKQTQAGVSAAVAIYGSGSNTSVNGSLTQGKLNYAQVATQSGLHAGEAGLTVNVAGNTHLKGGIVDSQASQEKNHFTTGSLTSENIENYSEAKVESVGGGLSTDPTQNIANGFAAGLSALGNINKQDSSTTHSAVGSNILLTAQQGDIPTTLSRDTTTANERIDKIEIADLKTRQEMAQVIGEIANNGITIVLKPKLDEAERQKAEAEAILKNDKHNQTAQQQLDTANKVIKTYGQGGQIQLAVRAVTGVLQGIATGEATQAAVGGLSPYANQAIKQLTTDPTTDEVNTQANLMAHALLGAVEAYATGNNAAAGAAGAVGGELAAKIIIEQLYQKAPDQLTEAQKQTVSTLSQLASGLAGGLISDSTAGAINAAEIGKRAVEDNYFNLNTVLNNSDYTQLLAEEEKGKQIQDEINKQVDEKIEQEYPLLYGTLASLYQTGSSLGKGVYIAREMAVELAPWVIGMGEISSSAKLAYYASKYPHLTEGLIAGTVSTGFDIYNGNISINDKDSLAKISLNYALAGVMAGKTWGQQLSINAIYQGITLSDQNLSDKDFVRNLGSSTVGSISGFGIDNILLKNKVNPIARQIISNSVSDYIGTSLSNAKENK